MGWHLLKDLVSAQKLNFKKSNNVPASVGELKTDYEAVKRQPKKSSGVFLQKHVKLKLSDADIDTLTNTHIDNFETELKRIFSDFSTYPSEVKLALFDIIFNVGMTELYNKWPSFKKGVKEKSWAIAAKESNRKPPISAERNKYVKTAPWYAESDVNHTKVGEATFSSCAEYFDKAGPSTRAVRDNEMNPYLEFKAMCEATRRLKL